jgi:hypothetical protein
MAQNKTCEPGSPAPVTFAIHAWNICHTMGVCRHSDVLFGFLAGHGLCPCPVGETGMNSRFLPGA